ncbi:hypothetical protein [Niveispirillum sp. BGYR6]|uniref:hypothetical protein n=1 Tax=Niveispirillum sp. BGYR6 TaxID=2971249 RepID=UPI0022B97033|nr:hypothetical protein [Niveispirillum sp. BGYR6]MDG5494868.1 hypothetical protein [Niveispirillum sp. BGYR6]
MALNRLSALALLLTAATALPAAAAELVVVESSAPALAPGQVLDSEAALSLPAGSRLVLVSADGATINLQGPFSGKPGNGAGGSSGGVTQSLASLLSARDSDTASLGAVRAASSAQPLPRPWLVDASQSGHGCLQPGAAPVLWRAATAATDLTLAPADRAWTATTPWPAGAQDLALPADVPFADGATYLFDMDGKSSAVTLHVAPEAVKGDRMLAAWMLAKGCERQAQALGRQLAGK